MNIYLIGFMGSGKSSVGKALADKLHYTFMDLDKCIEITQGQSIQEIFTLEGETAFRQYEHKALEETFHSEHTVVACGGGTPCFFNNISQINQQAVSVYLQIPAEVLYQRLCGEIKQRPMLQNRTDLKTYISDLLSHRETCYRQARLTVYTEGKTIDDVVNEIEAYLKNRNTGIGGE